MVKESDYHLEDLWYTSSGGPYNKMAPTMVQKSIDFYTKKLLKPSVRKRQRPILMWIANVTHVCSHLIRNF